jgi:DNA-binding PucR family transcriptional regulator
MGSARRGRNSATRHLASSGALGKRSESRLPAASFEPARDAGTRTPDEPSDDIEYLRRREKELLALQETALDLNSLRSTEEVLGAIVRRARTLLGTDICWLTVYDPEREDFFARVIEGSVSKQFAFVRVHRDVGSCRPIVESKSSFVTADYRDDPRFVHDTVVDAATQDEGIISIGGVPLLLEQRVLGILYVADRRTRSYVPQEIALLSSLARHAAIALENARLLEETRSAVQQLEAKTAEVQAAITVHEQLISLVARGATLKELADMLASLLGGAVAVLDEEYHAVCEAASQGSAPAAGIEEHPRDRRPKLLDALRESRAHGRSVRVEQNDALHRRAVAIVSTAQLLGALVISRQEPFSDSEVRTFERGAIAAGIVLLSQDRAARALEQDVAELFDSLRNRRAEGPALLARHAERRGLNLLQPIAILLADLIDRRGGYAVQTVKTENPGRKIVVGEIGGKLAVLCSEDEGPAIADIIQNSIEQRMGMRPNIVRSKGFTNPGEFPGAYRAADRSLKLMQALGWAGTIGTEANLSIYATLFSDETSEDLDAFVQSTIGPLLSHDRNKSTNLAETVLLYLDNGYNVRETAKALRIHDNTLRQRLETIDGLLSDWKANNKAFEIHAALRLNKLRGNLSKSRPSRRSS